MFQLGNIAVAIINAPPAISAIPNGMFAPVNARTAPTANRATDTVLVIMAITSLTSSLNAVVFIAIADARLTAPIAINAIPNGMLTPENANIAPNANGTALTIPIILVTVSSEFWNSHILASMALPVITPAIAPIAAPRGPPIKAPIPAPIIPVERAIVKPLVTFNSLEIASYKPIPKPATPAIIAPIAAPISPLPNVLPINAPPAIILALATSNDEAFTPFSPSVNALSIANAPMVIPVTTNAKPNVKLPILLKFDSMVMVPATPSAILQAASDTPIAPTAMRILPNLVSNKSLQEVISSVIPSHSFISSTIVATLLLTNPSKKSYSGNSKSNPLDKSSVSSLLGLITLSSSKPSK